MHRFCWFTKFNVLYQSRRQYSSVFQTVSLCFFAFLMASSPGQTNSQSQPSFRLALNLRFLWPPTCVDLHRLATTRGDFWASSNSHATRRKFFIVWRPDASRHKLIASHLMRGIYGFCDLRELGCRLVNPFGHPRKSVRKFWFCIDLHRFTISLGQGFGKNALVWAYSGIKRAKIAQTRTVRCGANIIPYPIKLNPKRSVFSCDKEPNLLYSFLPTDIKGVLWEAWTGFKLSGIKALLELQNYKDDQPTVTKILPNFTSPANYGNKYGSRMRAYFVPPETGSYMFYGSCNAKCKIYVSSDESPSTEEILGTVKSDKPEIWTE